MAVESYDKHDEMQEELLEIASNATKQAMEDGVVTEYSEERHPQYVHTATSIEPAGAIVESTQEIHVESPNVSISVEIRNPDEFVDFENSSDEPETELVINVSQLDENHQCPVCENTFDQYNWNMDRSVGDEKRSSTTYSCSECEDGEITVVT